MWSRGKSSKVTLAGWNDGGWVDKNTSELMASFKPRLQSCRKAGHINALKLCKFINDAATEGLEKKCER